MSVLKKIVNFSLLICLLMKKGFFYSTFPIFSCWAKLILFIPGLLPRLPLLVGIRPGSSLLADSPVELTCSSEYSHHIQSIQWLVNNKHLIEDTELITESGQVISNIDFIPHLGHYIIECRVIGDSVTSAARAVFSVRNKPEKVILQKEDVSNRGLWIPFDATSWKSNRLDTIMEEAPAVARKDIYEYMNDEPSNAVESFDIKHTQHHQHASKVKFVEELNPISLPLVSYSSSSSSLMSSCCHNFFAVICLYFLHCIIWSIN